MNAGDREDATREDASQGAGADTRESEVIVSDGSGVGPAAVDPAEDPSGEAARCVENKTGTATDEPAQDPLALARDDIKALQAERDRLYEAWLRMTADFDNFRKRTERDRQEFREYALESFLKHLLPVLDNFERALDSLPAEVPKGFADGILLIHKQLADVLARQGLSVMETTGQTFDPHLHEAVETQIRPETPHHTILGEVVKGYRIGKRVLRPAMVRVSVKPEEPGPPKEEPPAEDPS